MELKQSRGFRTRPTTGNMVAPRVTGRNGALSSHHYLSAQAGIEALASGGNAVDAAVAAALVEGVVNPQMFSLAGEAALLIRTAADGVICVNGNMAAPGRATRTEFEHRGLAEIPSKGILAAGVPGAMSAFLVAIERFGSLSFSDVSRFALALAKDGFPAHAGLICQEKYGICDNVETFRSDWISSGEIYLCAGEVPQEGELIRNPALAGALEYLALEEKLCGSTREAGIAAAHAAFYCGEIAEAICDHTRARDGLLEPSDFNRFSAKIEAPISKVYGSHEIFKCNTWSQGSTFLQSLSILEQFDLLSLGHNSIEYVHLLVEAMKLAFADREQYYGDPEFLRVPIEELVSSSYGAIRSTLIDSTAHAGLRPGEPRIPSAIVPEEERIGGAGWGPGTIHVDAADCSGMAVALTASGAWISASEVVSNLGLPLGMRLSNFVLAPAHHPNVLEPYKRPRTTMSPSLAIGDNGDILAFGTMGGDQQDQWQLQFFLNIAVFGMGIREAIEAAKFSSDHFPASFAPHDRYSNRVRAEETLGDDVLSGLASRGHCIQRAPAWTEGFIGAVRRNSRTELLEAAIDPRGAISEIFPACALAR